MRRRACSRRAKPDIASHLQRKKSGSKEVRPLGIPAVRDRIVQTALRRAIEPIYERDFAPHSYGFRPGRECKGALRAVERLLKAGHHWVVDADLKSYFDTIPHEKLMRQIGEKIADASVLGLIEAMLKAGVMESGADWKPTQIGAVMSPLLANIYLDPLDWEIAQAGREMIRYADDLVILCRIGDGPSLKERLQRWLQAKGLSLNEKKTRIVQSRQNGFEFLGFSFRWQKARKGTPYVRIEPSSGAEQSLRDRLRELTRRNST
jgi:RNA-directed DNA polymerase